jgi:hypothetical protein
LDQAMIERPGVVVVDGEKQRRARRQQGVGAVVGAPAVVGGVRRVVVEDGEAPGSSGASWGGLLLRRSLAMKRGNDLAIGALWWLIEQGEVARRVSVRRGSERRAWFEGRGAPFIVARGGRGGAGRSSMASSFQGRQGASDGLGVLATSMRS